MSELLFVLERLKSELYDISYYVKKTLNCESGECRHTPSILEVLLL